MRYRIELESSLSMDETLEHMRERLPVAQNYFAHVSHESVICTKSALTSRGFAVSWVKPHFGIPVHLVGTLESCENGTWISATLLPRTYLRWVFWFLLFFALISTPIMIGQTTEKESLGTASAWIFILSVPWIWGMKDVWRFRTETRNFLPKFTGGSVTSPIKGK